MDQIDKLKLFNDMNNGLRKADISKKHGVHPQTINYIYNKQKDSILRRYTQVCNKVVKDVNFVDFDKSLLEWLNLEIKSGKIINEDLLRNKAHETSRNSMQGTICTEDWLLDFRMRHNIGKYIADIKCSVQAKEEWTTFLYDFDTQDVYLGGVCALAHRLDFRNYANEQHVDNYVSLFLITNIQGTDKRELAVVGKDMLNTEIHLKSLPANYYHCNTPQVNYFVIHNYLSKWDSELIIQRRVVSLFLNIPKKISEQLQFSNIRIVNITNLNYGTKILEKLIECFKFHYRKLQIGKSMSDNDDPTQQTVDHICMMSMAWWNVPQRYIHHLCCPLEDGSLYFKVHNDNDESHCLSKWYKAKNKLSKRNIALNLLDKFIFCDDHLSCFNLVPVETTNTSEILFKQNLQSTSGIEAYQAIKRVLSYVQGKNASNIVIKNAKLLENHIEYGALLQIHEIIAISND